MGQLTTAQLLPALRICLLTPKTSMALSSSRCATVASCSGRHQCSSILANRLTEVYTVQCVMLLLHCALLRCVQRNGVCYCRTLFSLRCTVQFANQLVCYCSNLQRALCCSRVAHAVQLQWQPLQNGGALQVRRPMQRLCKRFSCRTGFVMLTAVPRRPSLAKGVV